MFVTGHRTNLKRPEGLLVDYNFLVFSYDKFEMTTAGTLKSELYAFLAQNYAKCTESTLK